MDGATHLKLKLDRVKIIALILGVFIIISILWEIKIETNVPIEIHVWGTTLPEKFYISQADENGVAGDWEEISLEEATSYHLVGVSSKTYSSKYWVFLKAVVDGEELISVMHVPYHSAIQPVSICKVHVIIVDARYMSVEEVELS